MATFLLNMATISGHGDHRISQHLTQLSHSAAQPQADSLLYLFYHSTTIPPILFLSYFLFHFDKMKFLSTLALLVSAAAAAPQSLDSLPLAGDVIKEVGKDAQPGLEQLQGQLDTDTTGDSDGKAGPKDVLSSLLGGIGLGGLGR